MFNALNIVTVRQSTLYDYISSALLDSALCVVTAAQKLRIPEESAGRLSSPSAPDLQGCRLLHDGNMVIVFLLVA